MVEEKKWYESKTLIMNIVAVILGVASILLGQVETGFTITLMGVLNAFLRVLTNKGIIKKQ